MKWGRSRFTGSAARYFECVVDPTVREILEEYYGREGYGAGVHAKEFLTGDAPASRRVRTPGGLEI